MKKTLSTTDTTRTTTSTTSKTEAAKGGARPRLGESVLEIAAAQWSVMSNEERDSYAALIGEMNDPAEPTLPAKRSAYNTFVALSAANLAADKPLDTTALPYTPCPPLPDVSVSASYVNKKLTLTLTPDVPYPHPIALKACKPLLASAKPTTATRFKNIGSIADFSGTVNATALFQSRYRVLGTGVKVVLEIMGVAPGGFHTKAKLVNAVVTSVAAEAVQSAPQDTKLSVG